jgi:hypothetical protein
VTVLGFGVLFHRTFKVRAGQVIEQHFEVCLKQIGPLLAQPHKPFLLVFQHSIQTAIQAIFLGYGKIRSQQCIHGGAQIPLAMHTKLAAPIQPSIHHQKLQHFFPSNLFSRSRQASVPKLM